MLKIKDNVDLKELEKFGFVKSYVALYPQAYIKIINETKLIEVTFHEIFDIYNDRHISILKVNKCETMNNNFYYNIVSYNRDENIVKKYIADLIKADLVEEVEE